MLTKYKLHISILDSRQAPGFQIFDSKPVNTGQLSVVLPSHLTRDIIRCASLLFCAFLTLRQALHVQQSYLSNLKLRKP